MPATPPAWFEAEDTVLWPGEFLTEDGINSGEPLPATSGELLIDLGGDALDTLTVGERRYCTASTG